jgi:hypothetical protein
MEAIQFIFRTTTNIEEAQKEAKTRANEHDKERLKNKERRKREMEDAKKMGIKKPIVSLLDPYC